MTQEQSTLLCIGHRGAAGHKPENTLASIREAMAMGAPCVEVDVYHVDGHLVVFHDDRLERTTNGRGRLMEQSFDYLRSLDAGDGERIPTLEEVCEAVAGRAGLNIELKGPGTADPVAGFLADLSMRGDPLDTFLVSSFARHELLVFRGREKRVKMGVLIDDGAAPDGEIDFATELGAFSVHPGTALASRGFIRAAHGRGLKVYVYTVNQAADVDRLFRIGADGVFTDFPQRVIEKFPQPDGRQGWR